ALLLQIIFQRDEGQVEPAVVRGVFTLREKPVLLYAGLGNFLRVFVRDALASLVIIPRVLGRPPIVEVSLSVKLAALIVESGRDFMANHRAFSAKVGGVIGIGIKERRLQDSGREVDGIELRIVVSVDRGRRHGPVITINRLADLLQPAVVLK